MKRPVLLTPDQAAAFARHLLLPEIGRGGQERLCAARFTVSPGADPGAAQVATDYLERAGVQRDDGSAGASASGGITPCPVPSAPAVSALAVDPVLGPAAEALAGAVAAVETIKAVTGAGRPGAPLDGVALGPGAD